MKKLLLAFSILFLSKQSMAQLATANFDSGLPAAWTMTPAATWSVKAGFGTASTSCLYTEEMNTNSTVVSYISPPLNLMGYATVTLTFKVAATKTNFLIPNLALSINSGAGKQTLCRWGSGFTQPTTFTLNDVADFTYPLDMANVEWTACTFFHAVPNANPVYYYFDAEMINGGYVLLDDIEIKGTPKVVAGINDNVVGREIQIYPIPAYNEAITLVAKPDSELKIYDYTGRELDTKAYATPTDKGFTLNQLPKGIYYVRLLSNGVTQEKTIVVE